MAQAFTSTEVTTTTNVFADNQSQRTNENTLRSNFSGPSQPSDPVVGQQWYDTTNNKTMQYNGTAWVPIDNNSPTQIDLNNSKGSLASLTGYLRVAHNDDGTLKTTPASSIDEFKDNALVITYISPTSFRVPLDLTGIFTANRKLKIYLSASTVITYVSSSTYDSGNNWTVVTTGGSVLDSSVTAVKYSIVQYGEREDTVHTSDVSTFVANSPGCFSRDIPFYASDKLTIATPNRLWVNIAKNGYRLETQKTFDISADASWDSAATLWQANHDYAVNDVIYPSATKTGYYYRCTTAGKSSAIAPTFPTTLGATYNEGNVVWVRELDFTVAANRKGKGFYIYSCIPANGTEPIIVLSANSTVPLRYTADTSRKVGGFHCLCADVGTIAGHTLNGYVAGNILPASVWDLNRRPKSEPEGMVYIDGLDMWVDIYLCSWSGSTAGKDLKTISKYGAVIGDGASTEKFHPLKWEQTMGEQKKRLPWVREFRIFSVGSNQSTNIKGSTDANTAGGHIDSAGRRMISNYGIEDCCGYIWQWGADVGYATTGSGSYTDGFDSNDRSDVKGQIYGVECRPLVGGPWDGAAVAGSRAAIWTDRSLSLNAFFGARGASEPMAV